MEWHPQSDVRVMLLEMFCREGGSLLSSEPRLFGPQTQGDAKRASSFFHQLDIKAARGRKAQ